MKLETGGARSGKTTRMVEKALELSRLGRAVYILAAHSNSALYIRGILQRLAPDENHGIKVESAPPQGWDWDHMRLGGSHPNVATLVDHYLIETKYKKILDELHAYDRPNEIHRLVSKRLKGKSK